MTNAIRPRLLKSMVDRDIEMEGVATNHDVQVNVDVEPLNQCILPVSHIGDPPANMWSSNYENELTFRINERQILPHESDQTALVSILTRQQYHIRVLRDVQSSAREERNDGVCIFLAKNNIA